MISQFSFSLVANVLAWPTKGIAAIIMPGYNTYSRLRERAYAVFTGVRAHSGNCTDPDKSCKAAGA